VLLPADHQAAAEAQEEDGVLCEDSAPEDRQRQHPQSGALFVNPCVEAQAAATPSHDHRVLNVHKMFLIAGHTWRAQ
jgi:hypothetical protein